MGRPKGGKNNYHTKEEKLSLVIRNLNGESIRGLEDGEEALINKRKPGNPLAKYHRKKELTPTEQLEYKVALLERELLKKDAEIVRLKKSIELERGDARRK